MGRSDFLFAQPSASAGVARALDFWATLADYSYNYTETPQEADRRAIASDWKAVGDELRRAIKEVGSEGHGR
jgi:hypothetical protein